MALEEEVYTIGNAKTKLKKRQRPENANKFGQNDGRPPKNPAERRIAAKIAKASGQPVEGKRTFPKKTTGGGNKRRNKSKIDKFPGDAPVDEKLVKKYKNFDDEDVTFKSIRTDHHRRRLTARKEAVNKAAEASARSELLHHEDPGFIETEEGDAPTQSLRQAEIAAAVDIASATKHFNLDLASTAPYRVSYTKNGRHVLLGGRRGHIAAFDNITKKLHMELNVGQSVRDVAWLHTETMMAAAQSEYTYIYDNQGTELHCIKQMHNIHRLEFLPYHFLLVGAGGASHLHWVDVSIGQIVKSTYTKEGPIRIMTHNPANAIVHLGHTKGTVTLWSPNIAEPLVKMLVHQCPVKDIAVDLSGTYMATTGTDQKLRIWDMRMYRQVNAYRMPSALSHVVFSARKCVAAACGDTVQMFKNDICLSGDIVEPYLAHKTAGAVVTDLAFCPYEDVLGVGHAHGFTSVLMPGCGEPNIDALEANPFQPKRQRREREVHELLDKMQPEMITLDTSVLAKVDEQSLEEDLAERAKILYVRPMAVEFTPRHKMKGKGGADAKQRAKSSVAERQRRAHKTERVKVEAELLGTKNTVADLESESGDDDHVKNVVEKQPTSVLDRFKMKAD